MQQTPQQLVYEFLRNGIVSGRFPGGSRIKSESVASELGVSRMPVREAFRQLDAEGLIILRPNRGAVVTDLTPDDILELFEMRGVLEGLAAAHAANRATRADLSDLRRMLDNMARVRREPAEWLEQHDQFHDRLCELSSLQRLYDQIKLLRQQVRPYTRLYAAHHTELEVVGHEHEAILDSMSRSPEEAERVIRAHVVANGRSIVADLLGPTEDSRSRKAAGEPAAMGSTVVAGQRRGR
jgi:DNA-binding GntR family transcriptional regulator